ncbi:MAG: sugar phosphate isomerase/epimerase [Anaerolineaceae bacterium]|nr:sugar phosphate isomerase/epimerase [Anaerolineaceae bacterium]
MNDKTVQFAVLVKPWKNLSLLELGKHIRKLGFDWIELPIRPGFLCEPALIEKSLPEAVRVLGEEGVQVLNITADLGLNDERLYQASSKAGIHMNRVIFNRRDRENYWDAERRAKTQLDSAIPLCEKYGFQIGVQNHFGRCVPVNAMGMHNLIKDYDPKFVGAVWDPAHNALEGEDPESALDIVASHLCVVNLKNAFWRRVNGPEAPEAKWNVYWTSGRHGRSPWRRVAEKLQQMQYQGPVCLSGEYSEDQEVDRLIVEDLAYAKECFQPI